MVPAVEAALSTTELLEAVLARVDVDTLLLSALRVSRRWHQVINASVQLQRDLFFEPIDDPRRISDHVHRKRQNPFLKHIFPAWFENTNSFHAPHAGGVNPVHAYPATAMMGYRRFQELPLFDASLRMPENPFLYPKASWRRMLVSQPACRTIIICVKRAPGILMRKTLGDQRTCTPDEGLRMGALYDLVLQHSAAHKVSGFMVVWPEGAAEGYVHLVRHLARMSGVMSAPTETSIQAVWEQQPDLVIQMLWADGRVRPGEVDDDDMSKFWQRCGALPQDIHTIGN